MIATKIGSVYSVDLPPTAVEVLSVFSFSLSLGLSDVGVVLECLRMGGYFAKLLVYMIAPYVLAILVVVAGCALSAVGTFKATLGGVALAIISNVCFSLRGLLGKQLSSRYGGGDVEVFFQLCALGGRGGVR